MYCFRFKIEAWFPKQDFIEVSNDKREEMILKAAIVTNRQSFKHLCCELIESNSQLITTGSYINYAFLRRSSTMPDLIITDSLEGTNCKHLEQLRTKFKEAIIVIISDGWNKLNLYNALHIGIDGYLSKEETFDKLKMALEEVILGLVPMSSSITRIIAEDFLRKEEIVLTRREIEVLQEISVGKSYWQVSKELIISFETTKSHMRSIFKKLYAKNKSEAVYKAQSLNLLSINRTKAYLDQG